MAHQASAQDLCLPEYEQPPVELPEPTVLPDDDQPIDITADRVALGNDSASEFSGRVEIRYRDSVISAESATYEDGNMEALGRVTYTDPDVTVRGEDIQVDTDAETIRFSGAGFDLPKRPARGSAQEILIQSDSTVSLTRVMFTTCPADNTAWELHASALDLDVNRGLGTARGVRLNFKGVPILYAPYFSFPINNERKSGFLSPDIGERDRTGIDVSIPYYLNLAENYDLTLEPRYMSKRGTQVRSKFRYLLPRSSGQLDFEYLPDDNEVDQARRYLNLQHRTSLGDDWQILSGVEEVSDDAYFEDLGTSLAVTSQTHLDRFLDVSYHAPYWSMLTRFQNYQTIDAVLTPEERPYERVPQVLFSGRWFGRRLGFDSTTELVNFDRDVGATGWRLDSTQELSVRFARAGMYLTPAVALRQTSYWLDEPGATGDDTLTRRLPVASLDTGLTFERDAGNNARWIQTLEPRVLYVRVPFEDQNELPVFDTVLPDFNLIQLFRKYQFVGPDRVTDTDQVSFGVTTRLIDAVNGRERLTATLGQTRYLTAQRVSLPGALPNDANASDYVAELSFGMRDSWNLDIGYQWNDATDSTARVETRFEFRPQDDRLFGFGYRYRQDQLEQGDLSVVWPAADRWRIIGRYSYSFLEEEPLEQFIGWEYEACCWRFRMISRRYVSRRTGETDSAISIQLELKGLSQRASSPEELLDRGILGYRSIARANQATAN
ncbi:MAG TPA: LPS assembly protein LptD [Gammaproteobacteria bacterium]|nr:LPS assembly protein LptD [Gammaproteobacteria bacterium]